MIKLLSFSHRYLSWYSLAINIIIFCHMKWYDNNTFNIPYLNHGEFLPPICCEEAYIKFLLPNFIFKNSQARQVLDGQCIALDIDPWIQFAWNSIYINFSHKGNIYELNTSTKHVRIWKEIFCRCGRGVTSK